MYLMEKWNDASTLLSLTFVHSQAQRSSCIPCNCRVNPSCVMCGGWPTPREDPQFELPTLERLSRLDLGVHPILSFPDGQSWAPRSQENSVYATISSFTCGGEDKQGVAVERLLTRKFTRQFRQSLLSVMGVICVLSAWHPLVLYVHFKAFCNSLCIYLK